MIAAPHPRDEPVPTHATTSSATAGADSGSGWAIATAVAVAVVARLSFLGQPFRNDSGIYIYLGKLLWTGGRLYRDLWETKLPTVALLTAPLYGALGNHWAGYVAVQAGLGVAAALALAWAVGRYASAAGRGPTLLFALVGFNLSRLTVTGFQLETVQLFFETLAACGVLACLSAPGRGGAVGTAAAAGALAGLAAYAKPTGLAVAAAAGLVLVRRAVRREPGGWAAVSGLVAGTAVPLVAAVVWCARSDFRGELPNLLRQIQLYSSGTPWRSLLQVKTAVFFLVPAVPWAIRAALARPGPTGDRAPAAAVGFAAAWMAAELVGVLAQRRLYGYHFLVLMPPAALLFGLRPRTGGLGPVVAAVGPLAVVSLAFAVPGWAAWARGDGRPMPVSRYVDAHTRPADAVWSDPACRLLLETGRPAGSRLQMTFYLVNHDQAPQQFGGQILSDFDARRPAVIVLPVEWAAMVRTVARETPGLVWDARRRAAYLAACDRLAAYVADHYHPEATVDGQVVYRRNGPADGRP